MKETNLELEGKVISYLAKNYGLNKALGIHNNFVNKHFNKYYLQANAEVRERLQTIGDYQSHQAMMFERYASLYYGVRR